MIWKLKVRMTQNKADAEKIPQSNAAPVINMSTMNETEILSDLEERTEF